MTKTKIKEVEVLAKTKFLSLYKGKNADMIIDGKDYDSSETINLIEEAHKRFNPKASVNSLKVE